MPVQHRGYGAYVSCDGMELEAYRTKVESDKTVVSCYIQSEIGKSFKLHWVDSTPPSHLSIEIRMDGRRMGVVSHQKHSPKTSNGAFRVDIDANYPYQFSTLATTDDEALPSAYSEEIGTIELRLRRARDFISVPFTPKQSTIHRPPSVHERNMKGSGPSHCISLGKKKETRASSTILRPLLIDDKPYVIFKFLYRPKEFLEAIGIVGVPAASRPSPFVSSPVSSASRRGKRPSDEAASDIFPAAVKRPRTAIEDETVDDVTMPIDDDQDDKENITEVHLSSINNYTAPGAASASFETGPCIKREHSPLDYPRDSSVKREPTPTREIRLRAKDNYSIPGASTSAMCIKTESHVKVEPAESAITTNLEQEKEEIKPTVKSEPEFDTGDEDSEEQIVEIHLSSRDCHNACKSEDSGALVQRELVCP